MTLPKGFGGGTRYAEREKAKHYFEPRPPKIKKRKTDECEKCTHHKRTHKRGIFRSPCTRCMCPNFKHTVIEYESY